jgi:hypothetical protein
MTKFILGSTLCLAAYVAMAVWYVSYQSSSVVIHNCR